MRRNWLDCSSGCSGQTQLDSNHFPQCRSSFVCSLIILSVDIERACLLRHWLGDGQRRWCGCSRNFSGAGCRGNGDYACAGSFDETSTRIFHSRPQMRNDMASRTSDCSQLTTGEITGAVFGAETHMLAPNFFGPHRFGPTIFSMALVRQVGCCGDSGIFP